MRLLLIEDEYPAAERLQRLLRQADPTAQVLAVLPSVKAAREWLDAHPAPDLILSDIQLSDGLSFSIFEGRPLTCPIIFTTSYDEYVLKAFRVNSLDYLLKPVKLDELRTALAKFRALRASFAPATDSRRLEQLLDQLPLSLKAYKTRFLVESAGQLLPLDVGQVAYFQSRHELTTLVARDNRRFVLDYPLEQLERLLDPAHFFRANRQLLLHLAAVRRLHPHFNGKLKLDLHPEPADEMLVSREKAGAFKAWLEGEAGG